MDVWIETKAGNLFRAAHTDRIVLVEDTKATGDAWGISVGISTASAAFATGLSQERARAIRNSLAVKLAAAAGETVPQVLGYDTHADRVTLCALTGE